MISGINNTFFVYDTDTRKIEPINKPDDRSRDEEKDQIIIDVEYEDISSSELTEDEQDNIIVINDPVGYNKKGKLIYLSRSKNITIV